MNDMAKSFKTEDLIPNQENIALIEYIYICDEI